MSVFPQTPVKTGEPIFRRANPSLDGRLGYTALHLKLKDFDSHLWDIFGGNFKVQLAIDVDFPKNVLSNPKYCIELTW